MTTLTNFAPSSIPKKKEFRVISFAYQFKTGTSIIKAVNGVYTPKDEAEEAYLKYQASKNLISYE